MNKLKNILNSLKFPVISIVIGMLVGGIVILLSGEDPVEAISTIFYRGFFTDTGIASTLNRATPIIYCGVAAALAWGTGYSSMGAQGQMILGALTTAIVASVFKGPALLGIVVSLAAGAIVGMLYSLLAAFISAKFNAYLLVVTLMMNYIADYAANYLTTYTFRDPNAVDNLAVQTAKITDYTLPRILSDYNVHVGFILAIIVVAAVYFLVNKTSFGYKMRMNGLNPEFARYGGVKANKTMYIVLMLAGAIAGFGGGVEVLGSRFRYVDQMITSPGYSWSGIVASLMSNYNMIGTLFSSIFLAGLNTGGSAIEISMNLASEITIIITSVITMLVTCKFVFHTARKKKSLPNVKKKKEASSL